MSRPVFALYLNTSEITDEKWDIGVKRDSGMALKLLAIVQRYGLGGLFQCVGERASYPGAGKII